MEIKEKRDISAFMRTVAYPRWGNDIGAWHN